MDRPDSSSREKHFAPFREGIVGLRARFRSPYGEVPLIYADWTASGRLYAPIERALLERFGPFVGNTHSESSETGVSMTQAYRLAHRLIKDHVHAGDEDVILTTGTGMTGAISKFQRILGLRVPDSLRERLTLSEEERPVVFITHMEHHSNQTTWMESLADVMVLPADEQGLVDVERMRGLLERYQDRPLKIGSFTSCSNVTGIRTPYHAMARLMHSYGGVCFVDFAASAPYVPIDMHPPDPLERLDAVFFSPHKFLGGPGSSGVLIFDRALYHNQVPDDPGGGTVNWTNPWGEHSYVEEIELREDGGTPGFLQAVRAAMAVRLKEQMGVREMMAREEELVSTALRRLRSVPRLHLLADDIRDRLAILSFYLDGIHYNLLVRLLNDRFGIQVRGGCSCAGTYGHFLLHVDRALSKQITERIDRGDLSLKPGWVRLSLHPTMTDSELEYILDAVQQCVSNAEAWGRDYQYNPHTNEYVHREARHDRRIETWFALEPPANIGRPD